MADDANQGQVEAPAEAEIQEGSAVEAVSQDEEAVEPQTDKIAALEAQIGRLAELNEGLVARFDQAEQAKAPKQKPLTQAQLDEVYERSPAEAQRLMLQEEMAKQKEELRRESQKDMWDKRTQDDFPIKDVKFTAQMNQSWQDLVDSGLDTNHPKAVYKAAEQASLVLGLGKKGAKGTEIVPTGESSQGRVRQVSRSSVSDNDPALQMYKMAFGDSPDKIKEYKKDLEARRAKKTRRR
jgi:hypothetical protein